MVWVLKIILFNFVYRFFIDEVVFVTMKHRSMEVIGGLLTFCDITCTVNIMF